MVGPIIHFKLRAVRMSTILKIIGNLLERKVGRQKCAKTVNLKKPIFRFSAEENMNVTRKRLKGVFQNVQMEILYTDQFSVTGGAGNVSTGTRYNGNLIRHRVLKS